MSDHELMQHCDGSSAAFWALLDLCKHGHVDACYRVIKHNLRGMGIWTAYKKFNFDAHVFARALLSDDPLV